MSGGVVLLHGWPGTADDFRRVRPLRDDDVTVLCPDLRGFGGAFDGPLEVGEATTDAHAVGCREPALPVAWADRLDAWLSDERLQILSGCGHFAPLEAPGAFVDAVRKAPAATA